MTMPPAAQFEQAMLPHLGAAYNLARWLAKDASLADDIVQDAFLRALGYFATFKGDNARAWLLRIVRNAAYGALAARSQRASASLEEAGLVSDGEHTAHEIADAADDPEQALSRAEGYARLDQALAALPAELRECLVLHELEDLSYKEIAQITGVPIGTVMSRLWRARQALMRDQGTGGPG
jgi:RNA polymerase sigma-70 factor (ECF subfamily)